MNNILFYKLGPAAKNSLVFLSVIIHLSAFGQSENQKTMTSFVPKSNAYDIYYPKSSVLVEDSEGVVTITDTISKLNITVSSYSLDKKLDDEKLIDLLNGFVK